MRLWYTGNLSKDRPIQDRIINDDRRRFWAKVDKTRECWLWLGAKTTGYGVMRLRGKNVLAHRFAYEDIVGSIPEGLQIDHLCRNPSCVNPSHLEVVTNKENCLRGESPNAINARKTHCDNGHPFDEQNTYVRPDNGQRQCRICRHKMRMEYHQRTGK